MILVTVMVYTQALCILIEKQTKTQIPGKAALNSLVDCLSVVVANEIKYKL